MSNTTMSHRAFGAQGPDVPAWARAVCAGIRGAGSREIVYVPDNPLSSLLRVFADDYRDVRATPATREEEAVGIAAGLYLGGARPTVMMQSSGLGNSLNAIASLLVPYQIPVLFVMSMRGGPGEWNWAQVPLGRAVGSILGSLGIQHVEVDAAETAEAAVRAAGELAFGTRFPAACLLPRRLMTAAGPTQRIE